MKSILAVVAAASVLAACGGGGSSGNITSPTDRYIGEYSLCDGNHTEIFTTVRVADGNSLSIRHLEVIYANKDCSGTKTAWVDYTVPLLYSYKSKGSYTVYGLTGPAEWSTADVTVGDMYFVEQNPVISGSATVGQSEGCFRLNSTTITCPGPLTNETVKDVGLVLSNGSLFTGTKANTSNGSEYYYLVQVGIKR